MTEEERDRIIDGLSSKYERAICRTLIAAGRRMTVNEMRGEVGRSGGMTPEIDDLRRRGLIRTAGRAAKPKRSRPMRYEITPPELVEETAKRYRERSGTQRFSPAARAVEFRKLEEGSFREWYRRRRQVIEACMSLAAVEPMMLWKAAPPEQRADLADDVEDLAEWCITVLAAYELRKGEDGVRDKIDKLETTDGRTAAEAETAQRLARKLRGKLTT